MAFCPSCGAQVEDGAPFCGSCGAPIQGAAPAQRNMVNNYQQQQPANYGQPAGDVPGKGLATGSMVCGIIGVVFWFFGVFALASVVLGIVGLVLASKAKAQGFEGGVRTAGFVLSIIATIGGALVFVACAVLAGSLASIGALM